MRRLLFLIACVAVPLALWAALPLGSTAATTATTSQRKLDELNGKIGRTRDKIGRKKGAERTLSSDIASYSQRIDRLQGRITKLSARQEVLQRDLDAKRAELEKVRGELRSERARLVRLQRRLRETRAMLATRLREIYTADKPDIITVVLGSTDFADLLERTEFIKRISDQDRRIVVLVRDARKDAVETEAHLSKLETRQQEITETVQSRRDEISTVRNDLIGTRVGYAKTKAGKTAALAKVRDDRHELQEDLEAMQAASAKIAEKLRVAQGNPGAGPIRRGSGQFIWPVSGPISGVFGESRPGHMHAGLDIAVGEGTPIRAADSGRVVLMQGVGSSGGYGNFTCIQHSASMSTCYAHQSRFGTSMGANVSKGQVIGYVGNTGHSFGAHLHFEVRVNGTPVNPAAYL
jgi:murein DD-endopeptidase MepM/ murein hydrolase activator NlpD